MQVGQKVYVKTMNNMARYRPSVSKCTVSKIGNKYFYLKEMKYTKFSLENMLEVSQYSPDYKVYLTREEIEDEIESADLINKIRGDLGYSSRKQLSLDQLRRINAIIEEEVQCKKLNANS